MELERFELTTFQLRPEIGLLFSDFECINGAVVKKSRACVAGSGENGQDDRAGEPAGGRAGLGERALGRVSGEFQAAGADAARGRATHHRLYLIRRLLHQELPPRPHGQLLDAYPQGASAHRNLIGKANVTVSGIQK